MEKDWYYIISYASTNEEDRGGTLFIGKDKEEAIKRYNFAVNYILNYDFDGEADIKIVRKVEDMKPNLGAWTTLSRDDDATEVTLRMGKLEEFANPYWERDYNADKEIRVEKN